ncbi:hypothetical protein GCM10010270_80860 [Streptomyces violaceus]|nr:hypothetical protein GCM10010270_80860 [Streptomyces janthinus]
MRYLSGSPWNIVFYDTGSRTALTEHAKRTAYELKRHTGVTFYVTTSINKGTTTCPTGRVIIMRLTSTVTRSSATQCHTATGAADGSRATFALTNWQNLKLSTSNEIYRRKVVSHELGHSVGLAHPSTWTADPSPLMRGDVWGGYKTVTYAAQYTPQDVNGLKNLRANASKLPPPTALTTVVNGAQVHEAHR